MVAEYINRSPNLAAEMRQKAMLAKFHNPILGNKYIKLLEQINSMASCGKTELTIQTSNYDNIRKDEVEMIVHYLEEDGFKVTVNPNVVWLNPVYEDLHQTTLKIQW